MPKAVEDKLFKEGRKKGYKGDKLKAYVWGTMRNKGLLKPPVKGGK